MRLIPLTQNQHAIIDDEDYDWLTQWKWHADWRPNMRSFYAARKEIVGGKWQKIYMHRQILGLKHGDKRQGDHIHHRTLDNRRSQIRIVTSNKNQWNRKAAKGYYWHKRDRKYQAQIQINGRNVFLGSFETPEDAHKEYANAAYRYREV